MPHKVHIISGWGCTERKEPSIYSESRNVLATGTTHWADGLEILNAEGMWIQLDTGWWIATYYNGKRKANITVHTLEVFSDGRISLDGGELQ